MFGIGEAIGSTVSAYGAYKGVKDQNKANQKLAREQMDFQRASNREQMDFQERMSNTAYQRSMEDMRQAGLNPILAYQQGGASSPVGTSSVGATARMENELGPAVSSAVDTARSIAELRNLRAQNRNIDAQASYYRAQTVNSALDAKSKDLGLPEKEAVSNLYKMFPGIPAADHIWKKIKGFVGLLSN